MIHNTKGFGVEDTPFMILATVIVIMFVTWMGISVMAQFVEGNEYQAAVEASTDIYKRAKLLSLGYDGSADSISVSLPEGYSILIDGGIVARKEEPINETHSDMTELSEILEIQGVPMTFEEEVLIAGRHDLRLHYNDGTIIISEE